MTRRKIKKVVDGDTIELYRRINGSKFVRLANVRAPEKHTLAGKRATNTLRAFVAKKTVTVRPVAVDRYGRVVGTVISDRRNINAEMSRRIKRKRRR